jgi:hypothetical protein
VSSVLQEVRAMQAVECVGRVLADGHLDIPVTAREEFGWRPDEELRVLMLRPGRLPQPGPELHTELVRKRHEAWQAVMELRERFAGIESSLTDQVVRMHEEEDEW